MLLIGGREGCGCLVIFDLGMLFIGFGHRLQSGWQESSIVGLVVERVLELIICLFNNTCRSSRLSTTTTISWIHHPASHLQVDPPSSHLSFVDLALLNQLNLPSTQLSAETPFSSSMTLLKQPSLQALLNPNPLPIADDTHNKAAQTSSNPQSPPQHPQALHSASVTCSDVGDP